MPDPGRRVSKGLYSDVAQRLAGVLVRLERELDKSGVGPADGRPALADEIRRALESVPIDEYLRGIEVLKKTIQHLKRLHDRKMQK